jgi:hypothetical protein
LTHRYHYSHWFVIPIHKYDSQINPENNNSPSEKSVSQVSDINLASQLAGYSSGNSARNLGIIRRAYFAFSGFLEEVKRKQPKFFFQFKSWLIR